VVVVKEVKELKELKELKEKGNSSEVGRLHVLNGKPRTGTQSAFGRDKDQP
jgi:hypothetical protein